MRKGEVRRQSIIEASERLFSAKGYLETTVDDILAELQCSKGSFYHYFDSKLSVLTACRPSAPKIRFTHLSMGRVVSSETANAVRLGSDGMPLTGTVAAGQGISMRGYCAASMTGIAYSAFPEETTSFPLFI